MKRLLLPLFLFSVQVFAQEIMLKEEMQFKQDKVTLTRDAASPKKALITLKTVFVNTNVNTDCAEWGEVTKFGPHPSCPQVQTQIEKCEKKEECTTEVKANCTVTQGQDCKITICKKWTDCHFETQTSMGSCSYKEKACLKYNHPSQERLVSIILKFAKSASLKPNEKEAFELSLELEKDGKTPRWEILFTQSQTQYQIEKKKESDLFGDGQYYYLISRE